MSEHRILSYCSQVGLALGIVFFLSNDGSAQKKAPPALRNPGAPQIATPFPLGMQRGTTLELTLTGANLAQPLQLWTNIPHAQVTIPTDGGNGKDGGKLRVFLAAPLTTPLGVYGMRLATAQGVSNLRLFCVDDLTTFTETDNNHTKALAQQIPVPCVVAGRTEAERSDFYKISARAGQRLSFEVLGHRLGSPIDPQITLHDPQTERELPGGHNNDAAGLQTDSRLTYTFKEAGDYLIEIRDVLYRGGGDYCYRLRIGDFPCATAAIPMAVRRGEPVLVRFAGPAVEGIPPAIVAIPAGYSEDTYPVAPRGPSGVHGWPVAVAVSDLEERLEQEPNDEPAKANRVAAPGAVTGRFESKGDVDCFVFGLKKGQRQVIEARTHDRASPTEVYIVLKNAAGNELARANPAAASRIDFTPPADGDYLLTVEHLFYWHGPAESYRVSIVPYAPDFDLVLAQDSADVPQGGNALVNVSAVRRDYTGPIEVSVEGVAGVSGQTTVTTTAPATTPLLLHAKPDAPLGAGMLTVLAKATINGKPVVKKATVRAVLTTNLGGLFYPPPELSENLSVGVREKLPFALAGRFDPPESYRGGAASLTITAQRTPGFVDEIALVPLVIPPNFTPALKSIPKNQNEIKVTLTSNEKAGQGAHEFILVGKAKYQNQEITAIIPPVRLTLGPPFHLKVDTQPLRLSPGGKAKLKASATRLGGYQGPITVEVRNLPAHVTAAKATVATGQTSVEIELTASANAAVGEKKDVNVNGTATAAGNQQAASANFAVEVVKK